MAKGIKKLKEKEQKVKPLLEVLKATLYAGVIFTILLRLRRGLFCKYIYLLQLLLLF